jgi:hypothetical protein
MFLRICCVLYSIYVVPAICLYCFILVDLKGRVRDKDSQPISSTGVEQGMDSWRVKTLPDGIYSSYQSYPKWGRGLILKSLASPGRCGQDTVNRGAEGKSSSELRSELDRTTLLRQGIVSGSCPCQ